MAMSALRPFTPQFRHNVAASRTSKWANFGLMHRSRQASLFDHFVGEREQRRRWSQAERLRSPKVDDEIKFGRRLHWEIGWAFSLQDAIDIFSRAPEYV